MRLFGAALLAALACDVRRLRSHASCIEKDATRGLCVKVTPSDTARDPCD
jgi:hypothetical protein